MRRSEKRRDIVRDNMPRFVRSIEVAENASEDELMRAFNAYKELAYRDIRISHRDLIKLILHMIQFCQWDHYVYSQMLHLLYEYRSSETALSIITMMKKFGVRVNSDDYMDAIRICSVSDKSDKTATTLWNMMIAEGYVPALVDYEVLMNCFVRSNNVEDAEKLFESIRGKGLKPTVWTYNTLLTGYKRNESWERALQVYQVMKLDGVFPDGVTYTILLDLLLKVQQTEYAKLIVKDLQGGENYIDKMTDYIQSKYPTHFMDDTNLLVSTSFMSTFDRLFDDETLKGYHTQFTQLFLRKSYLNSLLLWYIKQDNRLAIFYLYRCTMRSRKTMPNDLTYKLLFYYCGIKQDSVFYEMIMKNAANQGFTYNVSDSDDNLYNLYYRPLLFEMHANITCL